MHLDYAYTLGRVPQQQQHTESIRRKSSSDRLSRVKIVCGVEYHTTLLLLPRAVSCSRIWQHESREEIYKKRSELICFAFSSFQKKIETDYTSSSSSTTTFLLKRAPNNNEVYHRM